MSKIQDAKQLLAQGLRLLATDGKTPITDGFGADAPDFTCGPEWFGESDTGIAILCGPCPALGPDLLLCVDGDGEGWRDVPEIRSFLDSLPPTLSSHDARHLFFRVPANSAASLKQWKDVFKTKAATGCAVDLKYTGGYACERLDWAEGTDTSALVSAIATLPETCLAALARAPGARATSSAVTTVNSDDRGDAYLAAKGLDPVQVYADAFDWLETKAPVAVDGQGGHNTLLVVTGGLLEGFGLDEETCLQLLEDVYNPRCEPEWSSEELQHKIDQVDQHGSEAYARLELAVHRSHMEAFEAICNQPIAPANVSQGDIPGSVAAAPGAGAPARRMLQTVKASELNQPLPPVPWLVQRLSLAPGRPGLVVGRAGSGKTAAVQDIAVSVASGQDVFGTWPVRQGPVLHIDLDQGRYATKRRYQQIAKGRGIDLSTLPLECAFFNFRMTKNHGAMAAVDPAAVELLKDSCRGKAFVIIDSLRGMSPGMDENSSEIGEILQALSWVVDEIEKEGSEVPPPTFVVLHHSGKGESSAGGRGSTSIDDRAGAKWVVSKEDDGNQVSWKQDKASEFALGRDRGFVTRLVEGVHNGAYGPESVMIQVVPEQDNDVTAEQETKEWDEKVQQAMELVKEHPGILSRTLRDELGAGSIKGNLSQKVIDKLLLGAPECRGAQLWKYGTDSAKHLFWKSAEQLIMDELIKGPAVHSTLVAETCLPTSQVKLTLSHLHATGRTCQSAGINGEPAWELLNK